MKNGVYCMAVNGNPNRGGGWNNQQLQKDCGLIPWLLTKYNRFKRGVMVGMKCSDDYPYLNDMPELEMDFLPEDTINARINYINRHAADIDLLILYGVYPQFMPVADVYKTLRPDGKIYLASDMNIGWAKHIPVDHPKYRQFLNQCDIIGASNSTVQEFMKHEWRVNVELIRNGWFYPAWANFADMQKENIILTVGRIGSAQKMNHVLLEAFATVADKIPSWKIELVGSLDDTFGQNSFKLYVEHFLNLNPNLRDRIIFTGQINDKKKLLEKYKRAKISCLTSKFEGTPNAAAEALWAANFIITSSIDAANDITDKGRCGRVFPIGDVEKLAKLLKNICRDEKLLFNGCKHAAEYARNEFDEHLIVDRLYNLLFKEA